jgi:hypothetical protein
MVTVDTLEDKEERILTSGKTPRVDNFTFLMVLAAKTLILTDS